MNILIQVGRLVKLTKQHKIPTDTKSINLQKVTKLGIVAHAYKLSSQESNTRGSGAQGSKVWGQFGLCETPSQKHKTRLPLKS